MILILKCWQNPLKGLENYLESLQRNLVLPLEQVQLLNACGHDAISLIMTENTDIKKITKGKPSFKNVTWMDVKQEQAGLREEKVEFYEDLVSDEDQLLLLLFFFLFFFFFIFENLQICKDVMNGFLSIKLIDRRINVKLN